MSPKSGSSMRRPRLSTWIRFLVASAEMLIADQREARRCSHPFL
jgi:hypothetical protein